MPDAATDWRSEGSPIGQRRRTGCTSSIVGGVWRRQTAMKVVVHVDGGSRGNPGPAAAASVVSTAAGEILDEASELLGTHTNNVAEYRALLLGLTRARALGATEVEVVNDSELIAKQVRGL